MHRFYHDRDSEWIQRISDTIPDLDGKPFLHLEPSGVGLHNPGYLAQASDLTVGNVGHMALPDEWQHVVLALTEAEIARVEPLFRSCCSRSEEYGSDLRRNLSFLELLITLGELAAEDRSEVSLPETEESRNYNRVKPVITYILEHPTENMSLDSIASRFNYNKHYLCRVFKTATGISVGKYIMSVRIQYAATRLRRGSSVQESGAEAGYRNNSNFISTFKKVMDISPGQYRQQYRQRFAPED